jgi:hypothetical protein
MIEHTFFYFVDVFHYYTYIVTNLKLSREDNLLYVNVKFFNTMSSRAQWPQEPGSHRRSWHCNRRHPSDVSTGDWRQDYGRWCERTEAICRNIQKNAEKNRSNGAESIAETGTEIRTEALPTEGERGGGSAELLWRITQKRLARTLSDG